MADTKITALTALTAADPANDVIPIVDVSDTSMAASGTTKKISVNNILGASGTATLASATITGAATVGTTLGVTGASTLASASVTGALGAAGLNVTGATIPANGVYLGSANNLSFSYASTLGMTLNSTGLGVGIAPQSGMKLSVSGNIGYISSSRADFLNADNTQAYGLQANGSGGSASLTFVQLGVATRMTLDASGRLLVGSTSAFTDLTGSKEVKIGDGGIQTFSSAITAATATSIARSGFGGMVSVTASNVTGQYSAAVIFTSASATVVSVINGTGSTITFGVVSGNLQITSSLALANCIAQSFRNN